MTGRTRAAAGILLLTFIIILSVTAAPAFARSSPRVLRCPVVKRYAKYVVIKHASPRFRLRLHRGQHRIKVRGVRYKVVKLTHRRAKLRRVKPDPRPLDADDAAHPHADRRRPRPRRRPPATPTPTATDPDVAGLIMTASDITLLRERVAAGHQPYASAWEFFRDGKVKAALAAAPDGRRRPDQRVQLHPARHRLASRAQPRRGVRGDGVHQLRSQGQGLRGGLGDGQPPRLVRLHR